jgi:hypothetical protein
MSVRYSQSTGDSQSAEPAEDDERSYTTGADDVATPVEDETTAPTRPTFTPSEPASATVPGPAFAQDDVAESDYAADPDYAAESDRVVERDDVVEPDSVTGPDDATVPDGTVPASVLDADEGAIATPYVAPDDSPATATGVAPAADVTPADDSGQARPLPETTATDLDQPLLADTAELRARWQQVQAEFVDDPQEAVGDAANLIDQTTQAMIDALQVRQQQLRAMWEHNGSANGATATNGAATGNGSDTEHLRQMMRHYRTLFNQLCQ